MGLSSEIKVLIARPTLFDFSLIERMLLVYAFISALLTCLSLNRDTHPFLTPPIEKSFSQAEQ